MQLESPVFVNTNILECCGIHNLNIQIYLIHGGRQINNQYRLITGLINTHINNVIMDSNYKVIVASIHFINVVLIIINLF